MLIPTLLLLIGSATAEPMSLEGWRTLVRDAQRHVSEGSPRALVALRRLSNRRVRDVDGGVIVVDDTQLARITLDLQRTLSDPSTSADSIRAAAVHLALLEDEVGRLLEAPPAPYAQAIRPDGTLFATATTPVLPGRAEASWEPAFRASWTRLRAWVGLAISGRRTGSTTATAAVLVGTSLAALLLALWPMFRGLMATTPATVVPGPITSGRRHTPLGARMLAALRQLARQGLLHQPEHLTNGEVLAALPDETRGRLAPALAIHDRSAYGGHGPTEGEERLLDDILERYEETT